MQIRCDSSDIFTFPSNKEIVSEFSDDFAHPSEVPLTVDPHYWYLTGSIIPIELREWFIRHGSHELPGMSRLPYWSARSPRVPILRYRRTILRL